jgi:hypothetical protein
MLVWAAVSPLVPHCWLNPCSADGYRETQVSLCLYPEDQVLPRTSSKLRQKTRRAGVPTCPKASALTSRLGAAPGPSRVPTTLAPVSRLRGRHVSPWLRPLSPGSGWLRGRHVSPGLQHLPSGSGQLQSRHVSRGRAL